MTKIKIQKLLRKAHQTTNGGLLVIRQVLNEYAPLGQIPVEFGLKLFGIPLLTVWLVMVFRAVLGGSSLRQCTEDWNNDSTRGIIASYRKKLTNSLVSRNLLRMHPQGCRRIVMGMVKNLHTDQLVRLERVAIDSTKILASTKRYQKTGLVKIGQSFYRGYKLHLAFDLDAKAPLAYIITPINVHDSQALISLLRMIQSQYDVQVRELMMDRGYYGSKFFAWLEQQHILFYTPAKRYKALKELINQSKSTEFTETKKKTLRYKDAKLNVRGYGTMRCVLVANKKFEDWMPEEAKYKIMWAILTNNWTDGPWSVITKYRQRWQIEVFFKACKQHLGLNNLPGYDFRTINVHIATVLMAYLALVSIELKKRETKEEIAINVTDWINRYIKTTMRCEIYGKTVNAYFKTKENEYVYAEILQASGGVLV